MPAGVFGVVLFAAFLHASWNAIVKRGGDTLLTMVLVTGSAALVAVLALPFLPAPARASWPFLAASTVIQCAYFLLVARAYRVADMSGTYPVMRGSAPLLVALAGTFWLGEALPSRAWAGVGIVCLGILGMAAGFRRGTSREGLWLALANGVVIATYTLVDGIGVRKSGSPAAYTLWIFAIGGVIFVTGALWKRGRAFTAYAALNWHLGVLGGMGSLVSYGLALWAMTFSPVAVVAAMRETSILFATAISGLVLRERIGLVRIVAASLIAVGAIVLRSR